MNNRFRILLCVLAGSAVCAPLVVGSATAADQRPRYGAVAKKPSATVENANRKYRDKAVQPASGAQAGKGSAGKTASTKVNPAASRRYLATNRAEFRKSQPVNRSGPTK